jgi:transposase
MELPTVLATHTDALSPRMLRVIEELAGDWRWLDQRIDGLSGEIEALSRQDQACLRLMTVPGQRAGDRARQQARPHRLGGAG